MPFPHTNFHSTSQKPEVVKTNRKQKNDLGTFQLESIILKRKNTFLG